MRRCFALALFGLLALLSATPAVAVDPYRSDHVLAVSDEIVELSEQAIGVWHRVCHAESEYCNLVGIAHQTCQLDTWPDEECENQPLPEHIADGLEIVHCLRGSGSCPGSWGYLAAVIANDQLTESIETQALAILAETRADIVELVNGYEKFFLTCSVHKTDCATSIGRSYCEGWPKMCLTTGPAITFPTTTTTTTPGSTTTTTTFPGLAKFNIGFNVIGSRLSDNVCGLRFHPNKSGNIYPVGCTGWQSEHSVVTVGTDIPATTVTKVCAARLDANDATIKTGPLEETTHAIQVNGQAVASSIIPGASGSECVVDTECGPGGDCQGGECNQKCILVSIPLVNGDVLQAGRDMLDFGCLLTCNPTNTTCVNGGQWCAGIVYGSTVEVFDD